MPRNKTKETESSIADFINSWVDIKKRDDSLQLISIYNNLTGFEPKLWGPSIIGFGSYHYKYASGHEGDAPLTAFSPRKDSFVFYFSEKFERKDELLEKLGKFKISKACVYIKKLADIDLEVLKEMIIGCMSYTRAKYPS